MSPYHRSKFINEKNSVQYTLVRRDTSDALYNEEDPFTHYMFIPKLTNQSKKRNQQKKKSKRKSININQYGNKQQQEEEIEEGSQSIMESHSFPKYSFLPFHSETTIQKEVSIEEYTDEEEIEQDQGEEAFEEMEVEESFLSSENEWMDSDLENMESFPQDGYDYLKHIKTTSHPDAIHLSASKNSLASSSLDVKDEEVKTMIATLENSENEFETNSEEEEEEEESQDKDVFFHTLIQEYRNQQPSFTDQVEHDLNTVKLQKLQSKLKKEQPVLQDKEPTLKKLKKKSSPKQNQKQKQPWYRGVAQFDDIRNDLKGIAILSNELNDSDSNSNSSNSDSKENNIETNNEVDFGFHLKKKKLKETGLDTLVYPFQEEWDCMSMVSSYTNTENIPKLLHLKKSTKPKRPFTIPTPSSSSFSSSIQTLEQKVLNLSIHENVHIKQPEKNPSTQDDLDSNLHVPSSSSSLLNSNTVNLTYEKEDDDLNNPSTTPLLPPPLQGHASIEDKKYYKQQIKLERREKRQTKKALKLAFKEEKKRYQRSFALKASQGLL